MNPADRGLPPPTGRAAKPRSLGADVAYDVDQIQVLEGLEPVRRRPGMYIGTTDVRGLHHLITELIDNSVDEALAGECDRIVVKLHSDGSVSVTDNGRGIPVGIHPTEGRSTLEVVLTVLHAGAKFGGGGYKVSGGLHGVGVSVVNALSEKLQVWVYREGKEYFQEYRRGAPLAAVKALGKSDSRGTVVRFWPDPEVFPDTRFDRETIAHRLREMAYLNKRLALVLDDEREGYSYTFYFEGGILSFVRHLNHGKGLVNQVPFYVDRQADSTQIEIALQYNQTFVENVMSFANTIHTAEGGTHLTGFRAALTNVLNRYARKAGLLKDSDPNLTGDDVREGLTAVISVKLLDPQFEGQTKSKLGSAEVQGQVSAVLSDALTQYLDENPAEGRRIIEKSLTAARAREAARKARDLVQRKSLLESSTLPGKLADCSDRDPRNCELYIVEGDSAGGTAKTGRDRRTQAILPLRGKILNVEKARLDKVLTSEEIRNLITALGTGVGERFDYDRLRYYRIITMSVAGDEPTLVADDRGGVELVAIGDFIDECLDGRRDKDRYRVACFDQLTGEVRFSPLKAVIRHTQEEPLYRLTTRHGRSVKVTSSHSVFVVEDGRLRLKKGSDVRVGDRLAAPRQMPRLDPAAGPRIDLHDLFWTSGLTHGPDVEGEDVRRLAPARTRAVGAAAVAARREAAVNGPDVSRGPRAHAPEAFGRYLAVNRDLVWFLGWFAAAGTLGEHEVSLNLGAADASLISELSAAVKAVFSESPGLYRDPHSHAFKLYFHSAAAASLLSALGMAGPAPRRRMPDLVLGLPEKLQLAFLEGCFLGDGTISTTACGWSVTTISEQLKDGLLYLLGQLGVVADLSEGLAATKHPSYELTISGKGQLARTRPVWARDRSARALQQQLKRAGPEAPAWRPVGRDLMALEVTRIEEVEPAGSYVYDFSVEGDETFICGVGGLCAHNTDADVDGSHIRTLLLTFFYRHFPDLIEKGHVYMAQPPLYKLTKGKQTRWVYSDDERDRELKRMGGKVEVSRFKGLGEMNADQLWDTTMNPATRTLLKVEIEDAAAVNDVFVKLMGSDVEPRKKFITAHAKAVRNLDI